ncbi:MAG TPA: enhanced serine sensitivity protein SseB C-terminal domain-containing protein [Arsenophonus sp.]
MLFLVQAKDDTSTELLFMLIALEISIGYEQEAQRLILFLARLALDYLADNESIDFYFTQLNNQGIDHFIVHHLQPFYQRKIGSWLRNSIAVRNC